MNIDSINKPNLIANPDLVVVENVGDATKESVLDFVFADNRIANSSYFGAEVTLYPDMGLAQVRLYKD